MDARRSPNRRQSGIGENKEAAKKKWHERKSVLSCTMKRMLLGAMAWSLVACGVAQQPQTGESPYVAEAPLPKGWPQPGPYGEVVRKKLPAYRAAFTSAGGRGSSFWTLFMHIKKNDIPMTAPVEMAMEAEGDGMKMASMAFLYQNAEVGSPGSSGAVEVKDIPAAEVLSYAWQGGDGEEKVQLAKTKLEEKLSAEKRKAKSYRLLGYNGPGTPREKSTWELQAVLE
jgi:hypothetical protein